MRSSIGKEARGAVIVIITARSPPMLPLCYSVPLATANESPSHADSHAPSPRQTHVFVVDGTARPAPRVDAAGGAKTTLRISVLVAAMGLKAVPVSPAACKGVWSVVFRAPAAPTAGGAVASTAATASSTNTNTTLLGWEQRWVTAGDAARVFDPATPPDALPWRPTTPQWPPAYASSIWFRAFLPTPPNVSASASVAAATAEGGASAAPAPQLAVALSLSGMSKGVVYVNGWHLGVSERASERGIQGVCVSMHLLFPVQRYNLEAGSCGSAGPGGCAGSRDGCVFFYRAGEEAAEARAVPRCQMQCTTLWESAHHDHWQPGPPLCRRILRAAHAVALPRAAAPAQLHGRGRQPRGDLRRDERATGSRAAAPA